MYAQIEINDMIVIMQHIFDNERWRHIFNCLLQLWMNSPATIDFHSESKAQKSGQQRNKLDIINEINMLGSSIFCKRMFPFFKQGGSFHDQCLIFIS